MKQCTKCKKHKPLGGFDKHKRSKDGFQWWCKDCAKEYKRHWEKTTPKGIATAKRKQHPNAIRRGANMAKYNALLSAQKGRCAICNRHISNFKRQFAVDHCHKTGKVRSLLCANCNLALGHVGDSIVRLKTMIKYLESHTFSLSALRAN